MEYKGFTGSKNKENESLYYGKIEGIDDLISYESETKEGLKLAFIEAVDDYIETLEELKK